MTSEEKCSTVVIVRPPNDLTDLEADTSSMETEFRWCNRCKTYQSVNNFGKSKARSSGYQAYCKDCMKKYRKEHYYKNPEPYKARAHASSAKVLQYILEIKQVGSCSDCKNQFPEDPWVLQFDHLPEFEKEINISFAVARGYGLSRVKKEIAKCELVCANCHVKRTAKRAGWTGNRLGHLLTNIESSDTVEDTKP